jgi:hypothetical protein
MVRIDPPKGVSGFDFLEWSTRNSVEELQSETCETAASDNLSADDRVEAHESTEHYFHDEDDAESTRTVHSHSVVTGAPAWTSGSARFW